METKWGKRCTVMYTMFEMPFVPAPITCNSIFIVNRVDSSTASLKKCKLNFNKFLNGRANYHGKLQQLKWRTKGNRKILETNGVYYLHHQPRIADRLAYVHTFQLPVRLHGKLSAQIYVLLWMCAARNRCNCTEQHERSTRDHRLLTLYHLYIHFIFSPLPNSVHTKNTISNISI